MAAPPTTVDHFGAEYTKASKRATIRNLSDKNVVKDALGLEHKGVAKLVVPRTAGFSKNGKTVARVVTERPSSAGDRARCRRG
jgi:hypothetical protein